jgi:hypothetical protein
MEPAPATLGAVPSAAPGRDWALQRPLPTVLLFGRVPGPRVVLAASQTGGSTL